ncbi:MAG: prepilin-type N-terminal cleavage/methylation domain-containing protein [Bacillota bacterium]
MKKFLQKKLKDQKGMTLIELLAVIVIIAIIAAIAIPAIGNIIENSRQGAVKADFQQAISAANLYKTETGALPTGTAAEQLEDIEVYLDDAGSLTGVEFSDKDGSIAVKGKANANSTDYTISSPLTNSELGAIDNANFSGDTIGDTSGG